MKNIKVIYKEKEYTVSNPGKLVYSKKYKIGKKDLDRREIVADLEYEVKMKFREQIIFGNEGFNIKFIDDILNFISSRILYYNNK